MSSVDKVFCDYLNNRLLFLIYVNPLLFMNFFISLTLIHLQSYILQELIKKEQRKMISNLISEDGRNSESN